jgi:hypothetical protein
MKAKLHLYIIEMSDTVKRVYSLCGLLALCLCLLAGCEGMDATYKEFLGDGPIIYIGKADSVEVFPGRERVLITWQKQNDPRAKTARIFWNNGTSSTGDVPLTPGSPTSFVVDSLEQGSCVFNVYLYDSYGNKSVAVEATGNVYGSNYESTLQSRRLDKVILSMPGGELIVTFDAVVDSSMVQTEIVYLTAAGDEKTLVLPSSEQTATIADHASPATFRYRSGYLPEAAAIDIFYSPYDVWPEP